MFPDNGRSIQAGLVQFNRIYPVYRECLQFSANLTHSRKEALISVDQ
jgi:hypothetical protein